MADVHTPEQRSFNMRRIRSKDTGPELLVRKFLHANGFRYRLHDKTLPGKPDVVLPKYKTVIFIHGCFFHGHDGCQYFVVPKTKTEWWLNKINTNKMNDEKAVEKLSADGWNVIIIWECDLKRGRKEETLSSICEKLRILA